LVQSPKKQSRMRPQSRPSHLDDRGKIVFEYNSLLEIGDTVQPAAGGPEMTVIKSGYWDFIGRQHVVTVLVTPSDGRQVPRKWRCAGASAGKPNGAAAVCDLNFRRLSGSAPD
jgi:hypothetical protein